MNFQTKWQRLVELVMQSGVEVEVGEWQSQDVRTNPEMISRELTHITFELDIPATVEELQGYVKPNLPWAEDHFLERVSGEPLNPPPSEAWWPYARAGNAEHKVGEKFHHTYPERMWPKGLMVPVALAGYEDGREETLYAARVMEGIRYKYGDLRDVVTQLQRNPLTRQAYLPIWFPEDTGACGVDGQRVPCTLGYHFLSRRGRMDIVYYIRSCDLLRHFSDDVYMAARLCQWVCDHLEHVVPDNLVMHISSLHVFRGDYPMIYKMLEQWEEPEYGAAI